MRTVHSNFLLLREKFDRYYNYKYNSIIIIVIITYDRFVDKWLLQYTVFSFQTVKPYQNNTS